MDSRIAGSSLIFTLLAGAAAGASIALLTAPQTGSEIRHRLRSLARDAGDRIGRHGGSRFLR